MTTRYHYIFTFLLLIALYSQRAWAQQDNLLAAETCNELYMWVLNTNNRLDGEQIYEPDLAITFYTDRNCTPAWYDAKSQLSRIDSLIAVLGRAQIPEQTHYFYLERMRNEIEAFYLPLGLFDYTELYSIDVILTDAALHHTLQIVSERYGDEAMPGGIGVMLVNRLEEALKNNTLNPYFDNLRSQDLPNAATNDVQKMEDALERASKVSPNDTVPQPPIVIKDQTLYEAVLSAQNASIVVRFAGERLTLPVACNIFYRQREFTPAWLPHHADNPNLKTLITILKNAPAEGLQIADYHTSALEKQLSAPTLSPAELDLLLTDAALSYAQHLAVGKLNPRKLGFSWDVYQNKFDWATELKNALAANNLKALYDKMMPKQAQYNYLKNALAKYKKVAQQGGWQILPALTLSPTIGTKDPQFAALRQRLALELNTVADSLAINEATFDSTLQSMVKNFQRRHALGDDGKPGTKTFEALNITADQRVKELKMALETWRWLPNDLGRRYILVNIPAFTLYMHENNNPQPTQTKRVVVGEQKHKTPIFSDQMQYIELNPYWTVPSSIAKKEVLPALKRSGVAYLQRNQMEVFSGGEKINPYSIKWSKYNINNFPFTIRQKPNGKNALGEVKFLFPNAYNVYLHDTPSRHLFMQTPRAFSHGCIRLHQPLDFAAYLLKDLGYTRAKIDNIVANNNNQSITLPSPIPVYILYFTAWADENGAYFYDDIYNRESYIAKGLGF